MTDSALHPGTPYRWESVAFWGNEFALRQDDGTELGRCVRQGVWRNRWRCQVQGVALRIESGGAFSGGHRVFDANGALLAEHQYGWLRETVQLPDGTALRWRSHGFWGNRMLLLDDEGLVWLQARIRYSWRSRFEVTLFPEGTDRPLPPVVGALLAFLGFVLLHRRAQQAAAASA